MTVPQKVGRLAKQLQDYAIIVVANIDIHWGKHRGLRRKSR